MNIPSILGGPEAALPDWPPPAMIGDTITAVSSNAVKMKRVFKKTRFL
jgi:hypothetical protein